MLAYSPCNCAGPGSPTYALRQWRDTPVAELLAGTVRAGGAVVFASAAALTDFWLAWNHGVGIEPAWRALLAERAALAEHARRWAAQLAQRDTLAVNLARFCESLL